MTVPIYEVSVRGKKVYLCGQDEVLETIKALTEVLQDEEGTEPWIITYGYSDAKYRSEQFLICRMRRIAAPTRKRLKA